MSDVQNTTMQMERKQDGYSAKEQELIRQLMQSRLQQKSPLEHEELDGYEVPPRTQFSMLKKPAVSIKYPAFYADHALKTDRFTDALVYAMSLIPPGHREDEVGGYKIIRTDHRFHPHYRGKIYRYNNSFVSDIPHPYLALYSNSTCTLSDRVHSVLLPSPQPQSPGGFRFPAG